MVEFLPPEGISGLPSEAPQDSVTGLSLRKALRRYWLPAALVTVSLATINVIYIQTRIPLYRQNILLLVGKQSMVPVLASADLPLGDLAAKSLSTEIAVLTSGDLLAQVPPLLPQTVPEELTVDALVGNLSVQQVGDAAVLRVTYTDTDPQRVKSVLDALGKVYVEYSLQNRRSQVANAIRFITEQLPEARRELQESAADLRRFQEQNQLIDPAALATAISTAQQSFRVQQESAQVSLDKNRQEQQQLEQQLRQLGQEPTTSVQSAILGQDKLYQNLVAQLQQLDLQLSQDRLRFQEEDPRIQLLLQQRANLVNLLTKQALQVLPTNPLALRPTPIPSSPLLLQDSLAPQATVVPNPSVDQAARSSEQGSLTSDIPLVQSLTEKLVSAQIAQAVQTTELQSLNRADASLGNQLAQIPALQQTYTELLRQNDLNSSIVSTFLKQLQELKISEAQEISPWQVIQSAKIPLFPVSPQKARMALTGLVGSLLAGLGVAYLLNRIDSRIRTLEEAKEVTQLPILGRVPKVDLIKFASPPSTAEPGIPPTPTAKETKKQLQQARKRLFFQESFRSIALNLRYSASDQQQGQVLAVTSSVPSEGKSTCIFNLATSLAKLGYRVLVVDGDLRRPRQHELFQEINSSGLSSLFATNRPWQDLTHPALDGQLQVLTSGPCPPDPGALLSSKTMERYLQEWRQVFDYILIDTPPVSGVADTEALSLYIDGLIFVVCMGIPSRPVVQRALDSLRSNQIRIIGMVINQDDESQDGYYGYYNYYSQKRPSLASAATESLTDL